MVKSAFFAPEDLYYKSNKWYAMIKYDKEKFLKMCNSINGCNKASESGGYSKSGLVTVGSVSSRLQILIRK